MSNLPILSNTAQANSKSTAPNNSINKANDDSAQSAQPFGEVLARQISDKAGDADKKADPVKPDVSITATTDSKITATNDSTTTPLTAELLATLLPQAAAAVAAQLNLPAQPAMTKGQQPNESEQHKAPLLATDISADNKSTSVAQTVQPNPVPGKEDRFASALNSSADKAVPKNIELSAQPATPPNAALQSMVNLNPVAVQTMPLVINTPVSHSRWGDEFSQKITWLATSNQDQSAELHLNPPQLGPLDVVLKVSGDQATALFTSSHAAVREAIEQSIPKLREMLADNGIMLGNTTVSDQAPRDQRGESGSQRHTAPSGRVLEVSPSNATSSRKVLISRHNGVLDTFA